MLVRGQLQVRSQQSSGPDPANSWAPPSTAWGEHGTGVKAACGAHEPCTHPGTEAAPWHRGPRPASCHEAGRGELVSGRCSARAPCWGGVGGYGVIFKRRSSVQTVITTLSPSPWVGKPGRAGAARRVLAPTGLSGPGPPVRHGGELSFKGHRDLRSWKRSEPGFILARGHAEGLSRAAGALGSHPSPRL